MKHQLAHEALFTADDDFLGGDCELILRSTIDHANPDPNDLPQAMFRLTGTANSRTIMLETLCSDFTDEPGVKLRLIGNTPTHATYTGKNKTTERVAYTVILRKNVSELLRSFSVIACADVFERRQRVVSFWQKIRGHEQTPPVRAFERFDVYNAEELLRNAGL